MHKVHFCCKIEAFQAIKVKMLNFFFLSPKVSQLQMPGMPVTMGQLVPGAVPNMPHGAHSGCSAYAGTYSAAADPMLTYFSAIAGQIG